MMRRASSTVWPQHQQLCGTPHIGRRWMTSMPRAMTIIMPAGRSSWLCPRSLHVQRNYQSSSASNLAAALGAGAPTSADGFERYSEIDNSNEKRIQAIRALGMDKDEWIATEKVHGANFGMYSFDHGKTPVRFAKRSGIMPPNEHFFGYHVLLPELLEHMKVIRQLVREQMLQVSPHTVIVNGELFGGKYTHPNVPRSKQTFMLGGKPRGISAVQTDSFPQYSPNLHFYAFDIKYRLKADDVGVVTLTYDEAHSIFQKVPGLLFAKAIVRGPMAKVAAFDVETFQTTIPPLVGMGNFPLKGNWSEGLVVKHAKRGTVGWEPKGPTILKFKCVAFQEISTDRRQGPRVDQMEQVRKDSIAKSGMQLPALTSTIHDATHLEAAQHLLDHVTVNRLKNVVSKLGAAPFASRSMVPQQLADLVAQDALKDFLKEADDIIVVQLSIAIRRVMGKHLLFECRRLVNEQWKTIVAEKLDDVGEADKGTA